VVFIVCSFLSKFNFQRYFIRENQKKLEGIQVIQEEEKTNNYEPGNILLIYLDFSKTQDKFNKKDIY
jgi:hypothetical protein